MNGIIVNAIAVSIVVIAAGRAYLVVKHPSGRVVSLNGRLHQQCSTQHVGDIAIQTLNILRGVRKTHTVLVAVRINQRRTEVDELGLHRVINTCRKALVVRTCTLQRTFLLEVVETDVISAGGTTAAQIDIVVLAGTCLENFVEPVGVCTVLEMVLTVSSKTIAAS